MTGSYDLERRQERIHLLERETLHGVLISASRDPDAKLTYVVTSRPVEGSERLVVKIPATEPAGRAVDHEGRMLVEIRRFALGQLASTIPRYVESLCIEGRPVLVSTALAGAPMSLAYHRWPHTMRPPAVRGDFKAAFDWLHALQSATTRGADDAGEWPARVMEAVRGRWDGHPGLDEALARLETARDHLTGCTIARTAVHGDFWFGNLLIGGTGISGVVDWEHATPTGSPLRDPARFALSYALYLDRHTREDQRVLGHPGLLRSGFAPGIAYALTKHGWFPDLVRVTLGRQLERLGLSSELWYDVALCGIGEVAATANDDAFGAGHLALLAHLPARARRYRDLQGRRSHR